MNKDVVGNAETDNIEIMEPVDDSKPAAMNIDPSALEIQDISAPAPLEHILDSPVAKKEAVTLTTPNQPEKPKVKRKRRSPEKPWKKPKDMPKRPLSACKYMLDTPCLLLL